MKYYKMSEMLKILGWKRDKLSQWMKRGMVIPARPPLRRGYSAFYSFNNVVEILVAERLAENGIPLGQACRLIREGIALTEGSGHNPSTDFTLFSVCLDEIDSWGIYPSYKSWIESPEFNEYSLYLNIPLLPFYTLANDMIEDAGLDCD